MATFVTMIHWLVSLLTVILVSSSASTSLYTNSSSSFMRGLCSREESSALLHFKTTFFIAQVASFACDDYIEDTRIISKQMSYPKTENWKVGSDCCSWDGVTCDQVSGHVIKLDLSCSQLQGVIHFNSSLFQLRHMQSLNLAFNNFTGSNISSEFGKFADLTHLNLSFTYFAGVIPLELSNLSNMVSLDLSSNYRLEGHIPNSFAYLKKLTHLDLSYVSLSGLIFPTVFSVLKQIEFLDLSSTHLEGRIPNSFANLTNLTYLDLSDNSFSGLISSTDFSNLKQIEFLDFSYNQFDGRIPNSFANLTKLTYLDLSYNSFSGLISSTDFSNHKQIALLDLSYNNLEGRIPNSFANLTKLTQLDLSYNSLNGLVSSTVFSNLKQIEFLDLSYNHLKGRIPNSFANLSQLTHLNISYNYLNGKIPYWLFTVPSLVTLNLQENHLTGDIPFKIDNLLNLSGLILSSNFISGMIPPSLFNLPSLENLQLDNNLFCGSISSNITGLQKLKYLSLSNNSLNGAIPSTLLSLPLLTSLDLSKNKFTGHVVEFQSKSLVEINLSNNNLQVVNFSSVSDLVNLTKLNLASNNLIGTLDLNLLLELQKLQLIDLSHNSHLSLENSKNVNPPLFPNLTHFRMSNCSVSYFPLFLKNLAKLEVLELSKNSIHGPLPEWLGDIGKRSLNYLNLSHNFLTGSVGILPWIYMERIDLSFNRLEGPLPVLGSTKRSLAKYFLSNNKFSGEIHPTYCDIGWRLELDFSSNNLSGKIPGCLFDAYILNLQRNNFRGINPQTFVYESIWLTYLYLSHNQLEGQIPRFLANCTNLEVLNLGYNFISDTFPSWLESLPGLTILILRANRLHGSIGEPRNVAGFTQLKIIDLSYNEFSGNLPSHYFFTWKSMMWTSEDMYYANYSVIDHVTLAYKGQLMDLGVERLLNLFKVIDFSNNKFEGNIPKSIGNLTSLVVLNLSSNSLTGDIPTTMGNFVQLGSLDLSNNKLSGKIPQQLNKLTSLGVFNVSQNNLEGSIPQGGQLSIFPEDSYEGNPGLCGIPLPKKCQEIPTQHSSPEQDSRGPDSILDGFTWESVLMGYGCGAIIGIVIANIIIRKNEEWFLSIFNIRLIWRIKMSSEARRE